MFPKVEMQKAMSATETNRVDGSERPQSTGGRNPADKNNDEATEVSCTQP